MGIAQSQVVEWARNFEMGNSWFEFIYDDNDELVGLELAYNEVVAGGETIRHFVKIPCYSRVKGHNESFNYTPIKSMNYKDGFTYETCKVAPSRRS